MREFNKDSGLEESKEEKPKIRESSLAYIGVNVAKNSFLFTEGGNSWNMFSLNEDISTEPMEADESASVLFEKVEKDTCWHCLTMMAKDLMFWDALT